MRLFDKKIPQYVGVTGIKQRAHAVFLQSVLANSTRKMTAPPVLKVGVRAIFETVHNIPNGWHELPANATWANIFPEREDEGFLNTLHLRHLQGNRGGMQGERDLFQTLSRALEYAGQNLEILELDMTWPDPGAIFNAVHASRRLIQVILQIGLTALEQTGFSSVAVAEKLDEDGYFEAIDGVCINRDTGRGSLMDAERMISYVEEIRHVNPNLSISFSGSLGCGNLGVMVPVLRRFPDIGITAEKELCEDQDPKKPMILRNAEEFAITAGQLLSDQNQKK